MRRGTTLFGVVCVLAVAPACRADLLSGTVAYNPQTQLYTYSYTLTASPGAVQSFDIWVGPTSPNALPGAVTLPIITASPAGWNFVASNQSSGGVTPTGTVWGWVNPGTVTQTTITGFSFTTPAAPVVLASGVTNAYGSWNAPAPPPGQAGLPLGAIFNLGPVVGPDVSSAELTSAAPEPSALLLGVSGLLALAYRLRRARAFAPGAL